MSDVEINLGTGKSKIEGSTVSIGDVTGTRHDHLSDEFIELKNRVRKIEELLGGYLGIPGLTQELIDVKEAVQRIEQEIQKQYVPPIQYLFLTVSTVSLISSILVTIFGLWR